MALGIDQGSPDMIHLFLHEWFYMNLLFVVNGSAVKMWVMLFFVYHGFECTQTSMIYLPGCSLQVQALPFDLTHQHFTVV